MNKAIKCTFDAADDDDVAGITQVAVGEYDEDIWRETYGETLWYFKDLNELEQALTGKALEKYRQVTGGGYSGWYDSHGWVINDIDINDLRTAVEEVENAAE